MMHSLANFFFNFYFLRSEHMLTPDYCWVIFFPVLSLIDCRTYTGLMFLVLIVQQAILRLSILPLSILHSYNARRLPMEYDY